MENELPFILQGSGVDHSTLTWASLEPPKSIEGTFCRPVYFWSDFWGRLLGMDGFWTFASKASVWPGILLEDKLPAGKGACAKPHARWKGSEIWEGSAHTRRLALLFFPRRFFCGW